MLLFTFIIGFIIGVVGLFLYSCRANTITIRGFDFIPEVLGQGFIIIGSTLAGVMFFIMCIRAMIGVVG